MSIEIKLTKKSLPEACKPHSPQTEIFMKRKNNIFTDILLSSG